jgi:hypothetical protein
MRWSRRPVEGVVERWLGLKDGARVMPDGRKIWLWCVWLPRRDDRCRATRPADRWSSEASEAEAKAKAEEAALGGWEDFHRRARNAWDYERERAMELLDGAGVPRTPEAPSFRDLDLVERVRLLVDVRPGVEGVRDSRPVDSRGSSNRPSSRRFARDAEYCDRVAERWAYVTDGVERELGDLEAEIASLGSRPLNLRALDPMRGADAS